MLQFSRLVTAACVAVGAGLFAHPGQAQNAPAVVFESMLDGYFDSTSGYVSFVNYDIAFAPKGPVKGQVGILDGPVGQGLADLLVGIHDEWSISR